MEIDLLEVNATNLPILQQKHNKEVTEMKYLGLNMQNTVFILRKRGNRLKFSRSSITFIIITLMMKHRDSACDGTSIPSAMQFLLHQYKSKKMALSSGTGGSTEVREKRSTGFSVSQRGVQLGRATTRAMELGFYCRRRLNNLGDCQGTCQGCGSESGDRYKPEVIREPGRQAEHEYLEHGALEHLRQTRTCWAAGT